MLRKVEQTILRAVDPHLGYGYLSRDDLNLLPDEGLVGGCVRIGGDDGSAVRVAILGGSTSDISLDGSWLRPFHAICRQHSERVVLYSGAVSGYGSSQELIKLIRDLLPIMPKLVISLSGLNDMAFVHAVSSEHPMVNRYQKTVCQHLIRRPESKGFFSFGNAVRSEGAVAFNQKFGVEGVVFGAHNTLSAARVWERNALLMRALCHEIGAGYRCCLQPTMGVGEYVLSVEESESFDAYVAERKKAGTGYLMQLGEFYDEARPIARTHHDFMIDLTDAFRDSANVYSDVRHPNVTGNTVLARVIFDHCRGLI